MVGHKLFKRQVHPIHILNIAKALPHPHSQMTRMSQVTQARYRG